MTNLIHHASAAQARASDPVASVFVSANAGTGKTKLLTDRVLRLLLAGAPADSILCVTYTRVCLCSTVLCPCTIRLLLAPIFLDQV